MSDPSDTTRLFGGLLYVQSILPGFWKMTCPSDCLLVAYAFTVKTCWNDAWNVRDWSYTHCTHATAWSRCGGAVSPVQAAAEAVEPGGVCAAASAVPKAGARHVARARRRMGEKRFIGVLVSVRSFSCCPLLLGTAKPMPFGRAT